MATWSVTVGGTTVEALVGVETEGSDESKVPKATVTCGATSTNRGFSSGEAVVISKNGTEEFRGFVNGKPSIGDDNEFLELDVASKIYELQQLSVNRVFYRMDPGAILRSAIANRVVSLPPRSIHTADSLTNWTSDAPVFQLADFTGGQYREFGSNLIALGWRQGVTGTYHATFSGVPSNTIPGDGQIARLSSRFLVNNRGGQFEVEVGLQDNAGNLYVWSPDRLPNGFETHAFRAEEARDGGDIIASGDLSNGELRYGVKINGSLGEPRAMLIDNAQTTPFLLKSRTSNLTTNNVEDMGATVIRRFDSSVFEIVRQFATEYDAIAYIDTNDDLHFEPSGQSDAGKSIDYSTTPVTAANFDTDYDDVVNEVTVQYANGSVTVSADASIDFYGIAPRSQPIIKPEIQTEDEAISHGMGVLAEGAWADTPMEFTIADTTFSTVRVGERITVTWDPSNGINVIGTFVVSEVTVDEEGYPTIGVTGHVG